MLLSLSCAPQTRHAASRDHASQASTTIHPRRSVEISYVNARKSATFQATGRLLRVGNYDLVLGSFGHAMNNDVHRRQAVSGASQSGQIEGNDFLDRARPSRWRHGRERSDQLDGGLRPHFGGICRVPANGQLQAAPSFGDLNTVCLSCHTVGGECKEKYLWHFDVALMGRISRVTQDRRALIVPEPFSSP